MIRLEGVSKVFRSGAGTLAALSNVDLHVKPGSIFGVIGRSGAGKSTLLRCVNLLERPSSGKVSVAGRELTALSERDLVQARRSKTQVSLVITDINMPVMDGFDLARALRTLYPRTPILFITGRGGDSDSSTMVDVWGELLRKPFNPDTLLERVAMLLTRAAEARRTSA